MSSPISLPSSVTFDQLLHAAREGNAEAQGRLLEACRRPLLRMARKRLHARVQAKGGASDVVQETLLKAVHDIRTFQGCTPEQLHAWVSSILNHTTANFLRRYHSAKREVQRETSVSVQLRADAGRAAVSPSDRLIRREEAARLRNVLSRLPETYAQVLRLRCEQGLSFEDIGAQLARSADAARQLWRRAVAEAARGMR
jgi:RNA polymerase sigma-70 factor (ECF subfamily)